MADTISQRDGYIPCPICTRHVMRPGSYMCSYCAEEVKYHKFKLEPFILEEPEHRPKKHTGGYSPCRGCPKIDECYERVQNMAPTMCERWNMLDIILCQLNDVDVPEAILETAFNGGIDDRTG